MLLSRLNEYDLEELARVKTATMPMVEALVHTVRELRLDAEDAEKIADEVERLDDACADKSRDIEDLEERVRVFERVISAAAEDYATLEQENSKMRDRHDATDEGED